MWDQHAADADFAEADAPNSAEALEEAAATIKEEYEAKVRADVEAQVEALAGVDEVRRFLTQNEANCHELPRIPANSSDF